MLVRLSRNQAFSDYAQGVIQDTVNEASVSAATPDWCAVFSCWVDQRYDDDDDDDIYSCLVTLLSNTQCTIKQEMETRHNDER